MDATIIVSILSLVGTLVGSISGVLVANKLSNYRIDQLEKSMDKQNSKLESAISEQTNKFERVLVIERDLKTVFNRLDEYRDSIKEIEERINEYHSKA